MTESRLLRLFSTPVLLHEIENAEALNEELKSAIAEQRKRSEGVKRSNAGGWHSSRDLAHWGGEAGKAILTTAMQLASGLTTVVEGAPPPAWTAEGWANVNGRGDSNKAHVHGGCFWSGVYYVEVPDSETGQLLLHDPRMPALRMYAPNLRFKGAGPEQVVKVQPKTGLMVIFPGWLSHSVDRWEGDGERVSVAFNIFANAAASQ